MTVGRTASPGRTRGLGLALAVLCATTAVVQLAQAATPTSRQQLVQTVESMHQGGSHPNWNDNSDHCYSIYFRAACAVV